MTMNVKRFLREVTSSSYYREHPGEVLKYGYSKYVYWRARLHTADELLRSLGIDPREALKGFEAWDELLKSVMSKEREWQVGIPFEGGLVLYGLVRALKPKYLIETGIAAGISTSFICAALIDNGDGFLFSIDLPPELQSPLPHADGSKFQNYIHGVGYAIPEEIREAMLGRHKIVLEDVRSALPRLLKEIPRLDFFSTTIYTHLSICCGNMSWFGHTYPQEAFCVLMT